MSRNINLITYGFPCQDVSVIGGQKGINKNTRSGLLYDAERIINYIKPEYAIAENVKNLVGKKYKKDFDSLLKRLNDYGYNNYWKILNAKDYGIPQNRERVYIVSVRKNIDYKSFRFPKPFSNNLKLNDMLEKKVDKKYYINSKVSKKLFEELKNKEISNSIRVGGRGSVDRHQWDLVITSNKVRQLTPLECWRLMGFTDDDYKRSKESLEENFYNGKDRTNTQMYKMAGNSIVINVLEEIYKNLFKTT